MSNVSGFANAGQLFEVYGLDSSVANLASLNSFCKKKSIKAIVYQSATVRFLSQASLHWAKPTRCSPFQRRQPEKKSTEK